MVVVAPEITTKTRAQAGTQRRRISHISDFQRQQLRAIDFISWRSKICELSRGPSRQVSSGAEPRKCLFKCRSFVFGSRCRRYRLPHAQLAAHKLRRTFIHM